MVTQLHMWIMTHAIKRYSKATTFKSFAYFNIPVVLFPLDQSFPQKTPQQDRVMKALAGACKQHDEQVQLTTDIREAK